VVTTVNQCWLEGAVAVAGDGTTAALDGTSVAPDGTSVAPGATTVAADGPTRQLAEGSHALDRPPWVLHDRVAYVFLEPAQVRLNNDLQQGSWSRINHRYSQEVISREVFTLWIDHGRSPADAAYGYLVVPGIDPSSVARYAAKPPVSVLCNDPQLQAVWHEELGIAGLAFYRSGQAQIREALTVGVDAPCLVLLRECPERLVVSVSNPKNEPLTVSMEINEKLSGDGVQLRDDPTCSRAIFALPGGMDAGKSVTRTLLRR
jgi:chondroitin AC lyase